MPLATAIWWGVSSLFRNVSALPTLALRYRAQDAAGRALATWWCHASDAMAAASTEFPVVTDDGKLKEAFLAVVNTQPQDERLIAKTDRSVDDFVVTSDGLTSLHGVRPGPWLRRTGRADALPRAASRCQSQAKRST